MHSNRKVYQVRQSSIDKSADAGLRALLPALLKELLNEQNVLHKKILAIDNRLRFGYSEPLHDYKMALVRDDIFLNAKIMDELLKLHA